MTQPRPPARPARASRRLLARAGSRRPVGRATRAASIRRPGQAHFDQALHDRLPGSGARSGALCAVATDASYAPMSVVRPGWSDHRRLRARSRHGARTRARGPGPLRPHRLHPSCSPTSPPTRIDLAMSAMTDTAAAGPQGRLRQLLQRRHRDRRPARQPRRPSPTSAACAGGSSRSRSGTTQVDLLARAQVNCPARPGHRAHLRHELGRAGAAADRASRGGPQRPAAGRLPGERPAHQVASTSSPPRRSTSRASTGSSSPRTRPRCARRSAGPSRSWSAPGSTPTCCAGGRSAAVPSTGSA